MKFRTTWTQWIAGLLCGLVLAACGNSSEDFAEPFDLPVGPTEWDVSAPAWFQDGQLHVGKETVELGDRVDQFVLGKTGAYWMSGGMLKFTSAEGTTEDVAKVGWSNLAISTDHSVFATVDQSRGPTDEFGTHVMQVAVFDTRTGEELYRTPDEEPDDDDDLAVLYGELMPMLHGVGTERIFFDGDTIDLADATMIPATEDAEGLEVYEGFAETLFPDGYRVSLRGDGDRRELVEPSMFAVGRLSPDRSTIFDVGNWPTRAVVYDARSGKQRPIDAPWDHFILAGWSDADTFFGVAEHIDETEDSSELRQRQVVECEVATLACAPVSRVLKVKEIDGSVEYHPDFLVEGSTGQF